MIVQLGLQKSIEIIFSPYRLLWEKTVMNWSVTIALCYVNEIFEFANWSLGLGSKFAQLTALFQLGISFLFFLNIKKEKEKEVTFLWITPIRYFISKWIICINSWNNSSGIALNFELLFVAEISWSNLPTWPCGECIPGNSCFEVLVRQVMLLLC